MKDLIARENGRRMFLRSFLMGSVSMTGGANSLWGANFLTAVTEKRGDVLVMILGTAQDGGLPTMGCHCRNCTLARKDPKRACMPVSLGILNFASHKAYLMEATPETARQVDLIQGRDPIFVKDRAHPIDGILLTHADVGHYPGLIQFRPEIGPVRELKVHVSYQMSAFLSANEPWKYMVDKHIIVLHPFNYETIVRLDDQISFQAILIPHQKHTDAVAFKVRGPRKSLLFLPDIDYWEDRFQDIVGSVDFAFIDGTYFEKREGSKRHPPILEAMEFFKDVVKHTGTSISFIHFNHDNPIYADDGTLERSINRAGYHIAHQGDEFWL